MRRKMAFFPTASDPQILPYIFIYRLAGSESEARELLDKLAHGKGPTPDLSKYDVHAICSCIKKFLKSLKEPIIPLR